jgi:hypothetical protein
VLAHSACSPGTIQGIQCIRLSRACASEAEELGRQIKPVVQENSRSHGRRAPRGQGYAGDANKRRAGMLFAARVAAMDTAVQTRRWGSWWWLVLCGGPQSRMQAVSGASQLLLLLAPSGRRVSSRHSCAPRCQTTRSSPGPTPCNLPVAAAAAAAAACQETCALSLCDDALAKACPGALLLRHPQLPVPLARDDVMPPVPVPVPRTRPASASAPAPAPALLRPACA